MNKDIKTDWLFLLRSGEIKQGRRALNNNRKGSFCCLGVLCEMAEAHGVVKKNVSVTRATYDGRNDTLPSAVIEWAGLENNSCPHNPKIDGRYLANINDDGKSFTEIADLIEKHL